MARNQPQPKADREEVLECVQQNCPYCDKRMWNKYDNYRTVRTLSGVVRLRLKIRRCYNKDCEKLGSVYRPEAEGKWALPQHEFGLDVVVLVGALRYGQHRSVPEIHQQLQGRDICIGQRSVSHLIERYEELLTLNLSNKQRLQEIDHEYRRVILAIDGMQPDVGHEVLWVIRECLSGEILLARTLLSARSEDLAVLLGEVKEAIGVPIAGVVSDGQPSIRKAVEVALPQVPHGLCHFHYLREAAKPIYAADRHAKKELKKQVRGVRTIERSVANSNDLGSETVRSYCLAVRSALTDDGIPPLEASGLKLRSRLTLIEDSLERVAQKGD